MSLNIKCREANILVAELASLTGESKTGTCFGLDELFC